MTDNVFTNITKKPSLVLNAILWPVSLITIIAVFVPFSPAMPKAGLDPSWKFGLNQAVEQGLVFGRDIIFTFGPYASIYTKQYHPSTDFRMVIGSLYLAFSYWGCLVFLVNNHWRRAVWGLVFCAALAAGLIINRDSLLLSLQLLIGLVAFKISLLKDRDILKNKIALFLIVLLFVPLGLLPLIKGSFLILGSIIYFLCIIYFIINKQIIIAIICLVSPLFSITLFWALSDQPVVALPHYFNSMIPIISGYSEAMSLDGKVSETIIYSIASVFLLLSICTQNKISITSKAFLILLYFAFLFILFKERFVRHDDAHALLAGNSILIAALLLPLIFKSKTIIPIVLLLVLFWGYIDSNYMKTSANIIAMNLKSTYSVMWYSIKSRIKDKSKIKLKFDNAINSIRNEVQFPKMQGTTDVYSYNQTSLIASGNHWFPRPVFQSYSAYTPKLAKINQKYLLGSKAPDNIIFRIEPIDGRVPSIEDGVSWPVFMANYIPVKIKNNFLFLKKRKKINFFKRPLILTSKKYSFGSSIDLPQSNHPIFVKIKIKPTVLGRIASVFFKPNQLYITIRLRDSEKRKYRIISGMAKSGFLISPLIENTTEFKMLYGKSELLDEKHVQSITVTSQASKIKYWNNKYTATFSQINDVNQIDISKIRQINGDKSENK